MTLLRPCPKQCCGWTDINECMADEGGCEHNCTNLIGSYFCGCLEGYELDIDGHMCNGTRNKFGCKASTDIIILFRY